MRLTEIRVAGFGGQGVILSAIVLGKAASIYENGFATMTQNFGPEARGGACSAQLILSDSPVLYPYVTRPDSATGTSRGAGMAKTTCSSCPGPGRAPATNSDVTVSSGSANARW